MRSGGELETRHDAGNVYNVSILLVAFTSVQVPVRTNMNSECSAADLEI